MSTIIFNFALALWALVEGSAVVALLAGFGLGVSFDAAQKRKAGQRQRTGSVCFADDHTVTPAGICVTCNAFHYLGRRDK